MRAAYRYSFYRLKIEKGGYFLDKQTSRVHSRTVEQATVDALKRRGVTIEEIAKIVYEMQFPYNKGLTIEHCIESIKSVMKKEKCNMQFL